MALKGMLSLILFNLAFKRSVWMADNKVQWQLHTHLCLPYGAVRACHVQYQQVNKDTDTGATHIQSLTVYHNNRHAHTNPHSKQAEVLWLLSYPVQEKTNKIHV
jgi:hypothetical protein